jgi:hypothetical protein
MDWTMLKVQSEIVNNLVVAAAVAVGGGWAWYTFNGRLELENSRAQLEKIRHEIAALKRRSVSVELQAEQLPDLGSRLQLQVRVKIANDGAVEVTVPIPKGALRVTPVVGTTSPGQPRLVTDELAFGAILQTDSTGRVGTLQEIRLAAGTSDQLLYLVEVAKPGRFLIEFSSTIAGQAGESLQVTQHSQSAIFDVASGKRLQASKTGVSAR